MSNQTSRPSYLNQINCMYVIYGSLCCLAVGLLYIIGGFRLVCLCLSIVCCVIIIAWYLIKTGRITTEFFCRLWRAICRLCGCPCSNNNYDILHDSIPVHMLVAGETFNSHETFMQKLNPQIELCSAESSSVILLFCPVVSRIGTDMEAAMARVPEDKPVILVFMHHCHDPRDMTNITVQPSRKNIIKIIHCAFHESHGLLEWMGNEQAVAEVRTMLQK